MTANHEITTERKFPSRKDDLVFRGKTAILQLKRGFANLISTCVRLHSKRSILSDNPVVATSKTPLWTESEPGERFLVAGKIHNLRLAIRELDGLEIPAGEVFSFWKHVGRTNRLRGFVAGRELREGCIIPNIGGGLCQIEHKPRRLLLAAAKGIPVIASKGCGLENVNGIETVEAGDVGQLRGKILSLISRKSEVLK